MRIDKKLIRRLRSKKIAMTAAAIVIAKRRKSGAKKSGNTKKD